MTRPSHLYRKYYNFIKRFVPSLFIVIFHLISSPRNVSTAMMYAFHHRGDTIVYDEPFYAHYLSTTGVAHPAREEILQSQSNDFDEIVAMISKPPSVSSYRLVKNMAHHLQGNDWSFAKSMKNIFLIRDPKQLIASFAQVIPDPTMRDIGVRQQHEMYHQLAALGAKSVVVDSGDLLMDPTSYMQRLCGELEIDYMDAMVSWEPGPIESDGVWAKYWYKNVHASTGLLPQPTSKRPLPIKCEALYAEALPYYEELYNYALRI